jgi:hypothetical protein
LSDNFYDASLVLTFVAEDIDEADQKLDNMLELLEENGYETNGVATLETSIALE